MGLQWFRERCDIDSATDSHRTLEVMQVSVASRKFHKVFIPRKQHCGEFLLGQGWHKEQDLPLSCKLLGTLHSALQGHDIETDKTKYITPVHNSYGFCSFFFF